MSDAFPAPRRWRWWIPVALLALAATAVTSLQFAETNFRPHKTALVVILTTLLLVLWYILLTGLPLRRRLLLLGCLFAGVAGLAITVKKFLRLEGTYHGMGLPRFVWKWTPKPDANLPGLQLAKEPQPSSARSEVALERAVLEADFPEFLGPGRSNYVHASVLAPDWPNRAPVEVWRQAVGLGWSSFAVAAGRAITQEQRGEHELIVCRDLASGRALWAHTNTVRFSEALGGDGPRATPTISGERVFALGATGILDCLDAASGRLIWSRDTLKELGADNLMWGKSSSPLVFDELVVVSGGETGPGLLAFRRDTGAPAWRSAPERASYASPVLATLGGRRQILSVNAGSVSGHDPHTGATLWSHPWPGDFPKCSVPVAVPPNRVLISAGYNVGSALLEVAPAPGESNRASVREVWRNRQLKTQFNNVVVREGFAYGLDEGILSCIEIATGARQWKDGRYGQGQILRVDDWLLIQTERGPFAVVAAEPGAFREVARWPALNSKTWNTPVLAGEFLLLRNDHEAVCLRLARR